MPTEKDPRHQHTTLHVIYITIIVILVAIILGGGFVFHRMAERIRYGGVVTMGRGNHMSMNMVAVTPPPLSDQQKQQQQEGSATDTTNKTFNITAGNFYFVPNNITVNKGDSVTFVLTNVGGLHDLVIKELNIKTSLVRTGNTATVTFTASQSGTFTYYCDVMGHRQRGMWGTLTVK